MEVDTDGASVSVEQIRALGRFFETKTHIANHKIAIVYQAQTMTVAAANALLKTLEEPNDNSFIILVSKDEQLMLPTILSRCQVVKLRANVEQTGSLLTSHSDQFTNLTHLPEMTNQEVNEDYQRLEQQFIAFLADTKQAHSLINSLTGNDHAWRMLEKLIVNLARNKHSWYSNANFSATIDKALCAKLYRAFLDINETRMRLPQANQQLLLEKLIFNFANLIMQRA
jgi:DNA polymerase-3 subunit delta'